MPSEALAAAEPVAVRLPVAFAFLNDPPLGSIRYRVAYGGRGSAKSWSFARAALAHGLERPLRVLCAREYQSSIRDSVHRLLEDQIHELDLASAYHVERARIYGENGTEFLFHGIKRDPHAIKSLEGVDICWVEEAEAVTEESWSIVVPTIRKEGSEIWVTFNPALPDDATYRRFVDDGSGSPSTPAELAIIRRINWPDNPWLTDALKAELESLRRTDPEAYAHIWEGQPWMRSEAQVLAGLCTVEDFEPTDSWGEPLYGSDWGFAQDPTVLVRLWIYDGSLWIEYDERGIGWSMAEIDRRFRRVPGAADYTIRGDAARPETINELCSLGLKVVSAPKWSGSVEDGIEHLRGYERIVIHPRCKGLERESRLWRYKTDSRTGDVLPKLQPGNDHGWDAVRYALAPMIRTRRKWEVA